MRSWLMMALVAAHTVAHAQADVGLIDLVSGKVGFAPTMGAGGMAKAFMKVREGDRFDLSAGAQLRVLYFASARQERWQGPASLRAGSGESTAVSGAPVHVSTLPASVPQRIARVPDLLQNAKLGGIQVRGAQPARRASEENLREVRATYETLRKQMPGDDITPELFLYAALSDYQLYEDMGHLVAEMLRKQPGNEDARALDAWLKTRVRK